MKRYIIDEAELLDLLAAYHKMMVLEYDGVDNWEWYLEGKETYMRDALVDMDENMEMTVGEIKKRARYMTFYDLAKMNLEGYQVYEEKSTKDLIGDWATD